MKDHLSPSKSFLQLVIPSLLSLKQKLRDNAVEYQEARDEAAW